MVPEETPPPKTSKSRLWQHFLVAAFLVAQIGMPLSYYVGDDIYDERFAWRMFSPIRMVKCQVAISEGPTGKPKPLKLSRELALPWTNWMKRGHRRVLTAFAKQRCKAGESSNESFAVHAQLNCKLPDGEVDRLFIPQENLCDTF